MKLSIIIPVYNAEKYLEEAVKSILNQTWRGEKEIIIVDDHSDDRSLAIAKQLTDHVISIEHGGAAKARNAGLAISSGDYILFLDADDLLNRDALETLFMSMDENPNYEVIFARAVDFISPELTKEQRSSLILRGFNYGGVLPGCALIKKSVFTQSGYFDENLSSGETVAWIMNIKELNIASKEIEFVSLQRRLHLTNTGRLNREQEMKNYAAILRKRMLKR